MHKDYLTITTERIRNTIILLLIALSFQWVFLKPLDRANAAGDPPAPMPEPIAASDPAAVAIDQASAAAYEDTLVELVNQERWNNGQLPPLKRVQELDNAAETHSGNQAIRNFFGHCDLDTGSWPNDRMLAAGYSSSTWGENIAAGYGSPESVMAGWMSSSGHRANILSTSYREIGLGYFYESGDGAGVRKDLNTDCVQDGSPGGPYFHYWTQNFGRRNSVYPIVINREAYLTGSRSVNLYVYGSGWAQEMRFCNAGQFWSEWMPYNPDANWTLSGGNGVKTVLSEIRNGSTVVAANDTIWLEEALAMNIPTGPQSVYLPFIAKPLITGEYCGVQ